MISQATRSLLCLPVAPIRATICHLSDLNKVSLHALQPCLSLLPALPLSSLAYLLSFQRAALLRERRTGGGGGEDSHRQQRRITCLVFKDEQLCSPSTRPRDAVLLPRLPSAALLCRPGDKLRVYFESSKGFRVFFFLSFPAGVLISAAAVLT